jgi:UDP-N-acetyl-D-galactosamine dehydrogenase
MPKPILCIVGLGYVGLPLAHAFAEVGYDVIGYDINARRIAQLKEGTDATGELTPEKLRAVTIRFTDDASSIAESDIVILALPTPVDENNLPDLTLLESASQTVGSHLKKGMIVVYESTVYPGVTEEICGPILAKASGLTCGTDFTLGYSPERINPGDTTHTVRTIMKVVAGQDERTTDVLCDLYGSVVTAGIHRAPSIKVAEMAKAIENAQRDLNIAYVNEVAMLCNNIGIASKDVLAAAGTKWNFLKFQPGLVGGHCIGVDPFYLVEKARQLGMTTHVITAGRSVNEGMGCYVAQRIVERLPVPAGKARVLVLGMTFKENVPDTRNSKVRDVITHLQAAGCTVTACDPYVTDDDVARAGVTRGALEDGPYDAIVYLVPHREFASLPPQAFIDALADGGVFFDLKSLLEPEAFEEGGKVYLAL